MSRFVSAIFVATTLVAARPAVAAMPTVFDYRTVTHIGMVVKDVDKTARKVADVFELQVPAIKKTAAAPLPKGATGHAKAHTRAAEMRFDNGIVLEINEPVGGPSPWRDYLEKYGEGIHHLSFAVPVVEDYVKLLESKGGKRVLGKEGSDYALVDLMSYLGILIELTKAPAGAAPLPVEQVGPPNPRGMKGLARIGLMVADGDRFRQNWIDLFGVPVRPPVETAGRKLLFPEDFTGDPQASNREIYVPLNNMWVNLIQPVGGKSPWRDLLDRRQGAHYINFFVDDVNASDAYLTKKGGHRILGNKEAPYSYNDMGEAMGGLTVLLLRAAPPTPAASK
jgi:methylmalonyl-CoA/ethylmalonyl-CoA epimerase